MRAAVISPLFLVTALNVPLVFGQTSSVTRSAPEPASGVVVIPSPPAVPAPPEVVGVPPVVEPSRLLTTDSVRLAPLPVSPVSYLRIPSHWEKPITAEMQAKAVELDVRFFEWHRPAHQPVPVKESEILPAGYARADFDIGVSHFDEKCVLSATEQGALLDRLQSDPRSELLASTRMKFIPGRPGQVRRGIKKSMPERMGAPVSTSIPLEIIPEEMEKPSTHFLGTAMDLTILETEPGSVSMQIDLSRNRVIAGPEGQKSVGFSSGGSQMKVALRSGESFLYRGFRETRTVTKAQERQSYSVSIPGLGTLPPVEVASTRREQDIVEFVVLITPTGLHNAK